MAVNKQEKKEMQNDLNELIQAIGRADYSEKLFATFDEPIFKALSQSLANRPESPAALVKSLQHLDFRGDYKDYVPTLVNFLNCFGEVVRQVNIKDNQIQRLVVGDRKLIEYIGEVQKSLNEIGSLMSKVREYSRQGTVVALSSALMVIQMNYCILAVVTVLPMWHMLKLWCKILNLGLPSNHKIAFANANRDKYGYSVLRMPWDDASKKSFISAYQYVGSLGRKAYDKDPNWYSNQNERIRTLKDSVKSISQLNREIDLNVTKIRDMFPSGMFSRGSEFMRSPIHGGKTAQIFSGLVAKRNEQHRQEQEQRLQRLDDSVQEGDGLLDRVWSLFFPPARNLGV